ncbi:MAG: hypothetical protein K8H88_15465, partial [Sandaracinaceae bacterium]|nr:hypothetical protein [Sandaracinaceae bacterium]
MNATVLGSSWLRSPRPRSRLYARPFLVVLSALCFGSDRRDRARASRNTAPNWCPLELPDSMLLS